MLHFVIPVLLLVAGVAAGIMLSTVIGVYPYLDRLSFDGYVSAVRFLWPRYDPTMPILNGLALLTSATIAIVADRGTARIAFALAAVLLVGLMIISITRNVPINRYVASLEPGQEPADWDRRDPRASWQRWNRLRTGLAFAALAAMAVGAELLLAT